MIILKVINAHCILSIIPQTDHNPEEDREQVGANSKEIDFYQLHQSHKVIDLCCYGSTPEKKSIFLLKTCSWIGGI